MPEDDSPDWLEDIDNTDENPSEDSDDEDE